MKTGPDFEKSADSAVDIDSARGRLGDSVQNFQERAFAGAIAADDSERFATFHVERNILERPKGFRCRSSAAAQAVDQSARQTGQLIVQRSVTAQAALVRDAVRLAQVLN